jgi:hypothetical protein
VFEGGRYRKQVETQHSDHQDGAEENVFTVSRVVAERGGTQPRHQQVSRGVDSGSFPWTDVDRWELENKHSQAACWLVFMGQYHRAVKILMDSKGSAASCSLLRDVKLAPVQTKATTSSVVPSLR